MNDTVVAYGEDLLDADDDRIAEVTALGLDEVFMVRLGSYCRHLPWHLAVRDRDPVAHPVEHPPG